MLQNTVQRQFFSLGDMIVAGEHNGPLSPEPKPCGLIVCSENPVVFDQTVLRLMGFSEKKVPLFVGMDKSCFVEASAIQVISNDLESYFTDLDHVDMVTAESFKPADGWACIRS